MDSLHKMEENQTASFATFEMEFFKRCTDQLFVNYFRMVTNIYDKAYLSKQYKRFG